MLVRRHPSMPFLPHEATRCVSSKTVPACMMLPDLERKKQPNKAGTRFASRNFAGKKTFFRRLKEKHEPTCGEWFYAFSRMICHSLEIELHISRKYAKQKRIYHINIQEDALYATVHPFLACQIKRKRCLFELKSSHTVTKRHFMKQKNKRTKR